MNKIIEKCDVCINGSVVSKELLIKTFSSFVSSTIEDKQHNVGIVLHTGSVCFDAILLSFAAISNVLYNETNATDIVLSLQADDLVLCYDGNTGNSKPLKWIFKGFVNSVGDTPLMTPGKYIVLESDKNGRKYLPESRWTKIVPYFGSSKSMDGRGLRRESKKRYDFFRSVLGMEDAEIPRTVDTSTVIVMSREEANELVGSISFRFDDTDIKLTDLVPVSYYTESNREYQYGVNLSKNEPVIKITGKVSVARKLLLKKGGNRHIGLVVCGEDLYHRSESELPELLDRKSIQYVYLCMHLDSEASSNLIANYEEANLFACTKDFLLSNSRPPIVCNPYTEQMNAQIGAIIDKEVTATVKGAPARIHFCDSVQNERERIDSIIDNLAADGYRDVVLLTCKTEATSILSDSVNNGRYRNKYLFTTCRKFKGLEADVVILLDVDKATFEQENVLIFYVGTSRARIKLEITAILSDDDCKEILTSVLNYQGKIRRAKKDFAGALNAIGCLET